MHFIALDHVRALAAFLVFTWHFIHASNGWPISFGYIPDFFPFALLDEGHSGVALFMALSGYLFAKLLDGKMIHYPSFIWNRALRLLPLLCVVILIVAVGRIVKDESLLTFALNVVRGAVFPTLPNGGWSITVEFHFYLLLPFLLWMSRKAKFFPLCLVACAILLRWIIFLENGEVQFLAYWTIVGRVDQFALGMLLFHYRSYVTKRYLPMLLVFLAFLYFYWQFDVSNGNLSATGFVSPSPLWIILPTIEGLVYALAIAWYDTSFKHSNQRISRFIGRMGEYSFSIYLLHFFFVFRAASFIHLNVMDLSNFYVACAWSLVCFVLMMPLGYLSYRFIESPFLVYRRKYLITTPQS
jgi:peptidoglycan/LPS O-acetylase OafA/YrhL